MDRSTDISTQVQNVAGLIDEMVTLIQESVEHADVSAEETCGCHEYDGYHGGAFWRGRAGAREL